VGERAQSSDWWRRYRAALRRYKWLMALVVVGALGLGVLAARRVEPLYLVEAAIWIAPETQREATIGPMRADQVLHSAAWPELATSLAILDRTARRMALHILPHDRRDAPLFAGAGGDEKPKLGQYSLLVDPAGRRYTLSVVDGPRVETGMLGDSVGRSIGLRWRPGAEALARHREVRFQVISPRQAALALHTDLAAVLPMGSNLLRLSLTGSDPVRITATMRTIVDEFIAQAQDLKKRNLVEVTRALQDQLDVASRDLRTAEGALEGFRVRTITLPSEPRPVVTPAGTTTQPQQQLDPVTQGFFAQQQAYDAARRDRALLERTLAGIRNGTLEVVALSAIPAARTDASPIQAALRQLADLESQLAAARAQFTDVHPRVIELASQVKTLREHTLPRYGTALLTQLRMQENDLRDRVANTAQQLRGIPARSIEEGRLRRNAAARENLYGTLKARYEEARLAEVSAMPDVSVLDLPVPPEHPSTNRKPYVVLLALLLGLLAASVLAFVLDRLDPRFHYAEQATEELGLEIIGAVPAARAQDLRDPQQAMSLVEAFRSIRLSVAQVADASGRVMVTITSPNAGDGKSMIAANLARSFAQAGARTLLIDGDIRRGELDKRFEIERTPGLLDYLNGDTTLEQVLRATSTDGLSLITRGTPHARGPEMLMMPILPILLKELQRRFSVVIVDSSPLGAGIDPCVLGAATVNMLLVFRTGESNRKLAGAKLSLLARLPIRLLGVVLNHVGAEGDFQYYAYSYSENSEEQDASELDAQATEFAQRSGIPSVKR
jgi:succinoglycan biosynthesis transport protein ExoP